MTILITRGDTLITVSDDSSSVTRTHDCRSIRNAVELEQKLNDDKPFANIWMRMVDMKFPRN